MKNFLKPPKPEIHPSLMTPDERDRFRQRRRAYLKRKLLARMIGVFLLIVMIVGIVVSAVSKHKSDAEGLEAEEVEQTDVSEEEETKEKKGLFKLFSKKDDEQELSDDPAVAEVEEAAKDIELPEVKKKPRREFIYDIVDENGNILTTVTGELGVNLKTEKERKAEAEAKAIALAKRMDHSEARAHAEEIVKNFDYAKAAKNSEEIIEEFNRVIYEAVETAATKPMPEGVDSPYGILIDMRTGNIVANKNCRDRINPASMTKVMTILTAADLLKDKNLKEKVTVSQEATSYAYKNDCSTAGFSPDEEVTLEDLFYGTILPSGGDATYQLAIECAGSLELFVKCMNKKAMDMGLQGTNFTNPVGLFDENHYSTCYDIAMIMEAALDNEFCKEVLTKHYIVTTKSNKHPEGIELSNWFLRRIEDKDFGGIIEGGKTGYVVESGNCAVSTENANNGGHYLCVTAGAQSGWQCIYDHVEIYNMVK